MDRSLTLYHVYLAQITCSHIGNISCSLVVFLIVYFVDGYVSLLWMKNEDCLWWKNGTLDNRSIFCWKCCSLSFLLVISTFLIAFSSRDTYIFNFVVCANHSYGGSVERMSVEELEEGKKWLNDTFYLIR